MKRLLRTAANQPRLGLNFPYSFLPKLGRSHLLIGGVRLFSPR